MKKMIISPSILDVKEDELKEKIKIIEKSAGKWLHFDVMDGKFVPNVSFDSSLLKSIKEYSKLFMDVHLMVEDVEGQVNEFIKAGPDLISFHFEATQYPIRSINNIHRAGLKAGIVIKPETKVNQLKDLFDYVDVILVMAVEPGMGGQKFIKSTLKKIEKLNYLREKENYKYLIQVDGGINNVNAKLCKEAGADILVSGSYIFKSKNINKAIKSLM